METLPAFCPDVQTECSRPIHAGLTLLPMHKSQDAVLVSRQSTKERANLGGGCSNVTMSSS